MNLLEPGLAFLEGLALIVSPCILPVLPLVLSASVEGGRRRPFGIITGFVLAFSAFALLSRKLVSLLGIDLALIRNASLGLLLMFGLVLLSDRLSQRFSQWTQGFAGTGTRLSATSGEGFFSGIAIGALIGLIWTPCAGPILAAVLVQVIRQQSDWQGTLVIVAFAIGAGVPMLLIALTGRTLMNKLGFFTRHAEAVRKGFGVIIVLAVLFIASGIDAQTLFSKSTASLSGNSNGLEHGLGKPYPAPEFAAGGTWLNSPPLTMKQLRGKVVLVDFWTYSCINCVRTLPYITSWDKKYRDKGLVIIGVHAPEFEFEKNAENVKAAIAEHGIRYPVVLDNDLSTWTNFHNQYWPAHYLIDREGRVVYTHFGEGEYDVTENNIRYLLGVKGKAEVAPQESSSFGSQTPETYLGSARAESFVSAKPITLGATGEYQLPKFLPVDSWALQGKWNIEGEKVVSAAPGAALQLNFRGRKVFLVLGTATGKPVRIALTLNGEKLIANAGKDVKGGTLMINRHTLYELVDQKTSRNGLLEIRAEDAGLEAYAFTFGG